MVKLHAKRTAAEWREDPEAAFEIERRLCRSGFDSIDINAEVFVQARDDGLLNHFAHQEEIAALSPPCALSHAVALLAEDRLPCLRASIPGVVHPNR